MFASCTTGSCRKTADAKKSTLDQLLGDDDWGDNATLERMSLVNRAIFQAPEPSYSASNHPWSPADAVMLDTRLGYHFPAVMIKCKRAPATRAVIHCHANACDVGHVYELCQRDAECWQANVLLVEYPGYGASPGACYERNVDRHVVCAYLYLIEDLGYDPESVILFGRSLGSGPVCRLAHRLQTLRWRPVGGVVLHSPFVSVREAGISLLGGVARMMSERWDNRIPLAELRCRLLIVHGASDEVIPFHHAETLRNVRKENNLHCMFFPTQGTHNYFSYYRDYLRPVEKFVAGHEGRKLPPLPDPLPRAEHSKADADALIEARRREAAESRRRAKAAAAAAKAKGAKKEAGPGEDDDGATTTTNGADGDDAFAWNEGTSGGFGSDGAGGDSGDGDDDGDDGGGGDAPWKSPNGKKGGRSKFVPGGASPIGSRSTRLCM